MCENYSREETIQGRKLYEEIRYFSRNVTPKRNLKCVLVNRFKIYYSYSPKIVVNSTVKLYIILHIYAYGGCLLEVLSSIQCNGTTFPIHFLGLKSKKVKCFNKVKEVRIVKEQDIWSKNNSSIF